MMKISMCKYLIKSLFILIFIAGFSNFVMAKESTYVSVSPSITEIIYSIGAQDSLIGVSSRCNYPREAKSKPIIGDSYFLNKERIIKLHPDYIFTVEATEGTFNEFKYTDVKPLYFKMNSVEDIYSNIKFIGQMTSKEKQAEQLIKNIKAQISLNKTKNPKKILYIIQTNPMITVGSDSFITDVIKKSGHNSVTQSVKGYYPSISVEYAIKSNPDYIVVCFDDDKKLKKLFPKSKIILLTNEQKDVINRPSPRVYQSVKFFSSL